MGYECSYCKKASVRSKDNLIDSGWSFLDIYSPKRLHIVVCSNFDCHDKMKEELKTYLKRKRKRKII